MKTCPSIAIALALLTIAGSASAVVAVQEGAVPAPNARVQPSPAAAIQSGAIGAVAANGQIQINGQWFKVVTGTTRVFRQGREVRTDALAKGTAVRFTTGADKATLGIVYLQ